MLVRALLFVSDEAVRERLRRSLEDLDIVVTEPPGESRLWDLLRSETFDLLFTTRAALPDPVEESISRFRTLAERSEVILLSDEEDLELRTRLLAAGALAVLPSSLSAEGLQETLATFVERQRDVAVEQVRADREIDTSTLGDFSSESPAMRELLRLAKKVASADTSLLILGETGTGKEWLGRAIHAQGPRASGPFIAVNPSALPEQLLESELFGHDKGAFTGAFRARRGAFELAHGGTLFLDEIGDMPAHLQIKLLRVLQEREIKRLGSEQPVAVDVRIMAATNQDLDAAIESKTFRRDLYFRLSVLKLTVPPLRDRREDIPPLVETYVELYRRQLGRLDIEGTSLEAMKALQSYDWPGNVRELINIIERSVLLCEGKLITLDELPEEVAGPGAGPVSAGGTGDLDFRTWMDRPLPEAREAILCAFESSYLSHLLAETNGNVGAAAARAGVDPRTLYNKMKSYGLRKEDFKSGGG
jgi:DNA-binding NtrC family response regulator